LVGSGWLRVASGGFRWLPVASVGGDLWHEIWVSRLCVGRGVGAWWGWGTVKIDRVLRGAY